ncbi:MAG: hypothetical protein CVU50_08490 [Candidatus Cloacimonetes bacterium HGW-Cloacimonetes-3]|nr:MAG: hypothetical protein CVU50_08490 [Candidatus Cloacimonetes bacterium HGW-Cloacimonetes-3]
MIVRFKYRRAVLSMSWHRHSIMRQIKVYETSGSFFLKYIAAIYLKVYIALFKGIIQFHKVKSRLRWLALVLFLPVMSLCLILLATFTFCAVSFLFVRTIASISKQTLDFILSHRIAIILRRLFVALLTLCISFLVSLYFGIVFSRFIVLFHQQWSGRYILEPMIVMGSFFLCSTFIMFYKQIRKEYGSFKKLFQSIEEGDSDLMALKSSVNLPRLLKWLFHPYRLMMGYYFIGCVMFNLLGWLITTCRLRYPHSFFIVNVGKNKFGEVIESYRFLIKQAIDVVPLSLVDLFIDYGRGMTIIKPWGNILQICVQAVLIIIFIAFGFGLFYYTRHWKYKEEDTNIVC